MESAASQTQNEDALRTASTDVFKLDYSLSESFSPKQATESFSPKQVYPTFYSDEHVVQLTDATGDRHATGDLHATGDHTCLIKREEKHEAVVKMDDYNEQEQLLSEQVPAAEFVEKKTEKSELKELKERSKESKQEVCGDFKESNRKCKYSSHLLNDTHLDQSHSSGKFGHTHHDHPHLYSHRTMDLVFRNIHVSIPSAAAAASKPASHAGKGNWFKQLLARHSKQSATLNEQKEKLNKEPSSQPAEHPNRRDILSGISGYSKPGQLLAVMGPSGSGKTTLLNTLSGRLKARKGSITVNGEELNKPMKRRIGYVMQNDVFFTGLTLKQTLVYTSLLRMPDSISRTKKLKHVQRVIELLDLTGCEDTIIGDFMMRGLSGGEKKRASIACELLTNPSIMLLDEPTSGLDSSTAFNLMLKIKEYAIREGKTVIATIHQPSSQIFYMFDKLLLLANGQLAYFGKSTHVVPFFECLGHTIAAHYNPADFMIERVKQKDEIAKIVKAAKNLIRSYPILSHSHHRGSNASACKHLLKLTTSKMEQSQTTDWSLIGMEDDLEAEHVHCHHTPSNQHPSGTNQQPSPAEATDHQQLISQPNHHHCHHFQKHHLNTLKESTECTNYDRKSMHENERADSLCFSELCCKRNCCKLLTIQDDDSGRSSWTETDRSSTATFSSNNSCSSSTEDVYSEVNFEMDKPANRANSNLHEQPLSDSRWPTSFLTQVDVLTRRNFCENRHRMLSKLNWIQTIGLGILSGLMWFQMNRLETTLNDIRGFLFFSTSYWMLFAWFGALITIQPEREVMNKERSSGAYRLSAFYIAKMIGELPLIITLPSLYFFICYPMFAVNLNIYNFLFQWLFMVLCALVAQSIGLCIGLTTMSLEVSVTVSAIYSTAVNLFGGYYSTTLPSWLAWMRYTSVLHYAFQNMQMIEFYFGGKIRCANNNSKFDYCLKQIAYLKERLINASQSVQLVNQSLIIDPNAPLAKLDELLDGQNLFIPHNELIAELNGISSFWTNIVILIFFLFLFRLIGYLVLRFVCTPK